MMHIYESRHSSALIHGFLESQSLLMVSLWKGYNMVLICSMPFFLISFSFSQDSMCFSVLLLPYCVILFTFTSPSSFERTVRLPTTKPP